MTAVAPRRMGFVGVATSSSASMKVFHEWAQILQLPTGRLVGYDIATGAPSGIYRGLVRSIREDPDHFGALVTTHKVALFDAAGDMFDDIDNAAATFGEVSSIAKRGTRLTASAKDPKTSALALDEFLPADHFARTGGAALVLGSGGAGRALSYQLAVRTDRPAQVICTALSDQSLEELSRLLDRAGVQSNVVRYVTTSTTVIADSLLADLPPHSLVVNATGMGKDLPGSPISDAARFPENGFVWEFNYRGSLEFLHQARHQQEARRLHLEDGWQFFIHGWSQVIADVFDIPMPPDTVARLAAAAEVYR
jgi:shikimate dehydrogenase